MIKSISWVYFLLCCGSQPVYANEQNIHFIKITLTAEDAWAGKTVCGLGLPAGTIVVAIQRGKETVIPYGAAEP